MSILKTCPICSKTFKTDRNAITFCSKSCASKHNNQSRIKTEIRVCDFCHKEFTCRPSDKFRFCSRLCSDKHLCGKPQNRKKGIGSLNPKNVRALYCEICGKEFFVYISTLTRRNRHCCSTACRDQWLSIINTGKTHPKRSKVDYRSSFRGHNWKEVRKQIFKRDNGRCQCCGRIVGKLPRDYVIHHIKPFNSFGGDWITANLPTNLITLCHHCHMKAEYGKVTFQLPLL